MRRTPQGKSLHRSDLVTARSGRHLKICAFETFTGASSWKSRLPQQMCWWSPRGLAVVAPIGWEDAGDGRSRMTGDAGAGEFARLVGKSVAHLTSSGSQNPVRYMNC